MVLKKTQKSIVGFGSSSARFGVGPLKPKVKSKFLENKQEDEAAPIFKQHEVEAQKLKFVATTPSTKNSQQPCNIQYVCKVLAPSDRKPPLYPGPLVVRNKRRMMKKWEDERMPPIIVQMEKQRIKNREKAQAATRAVLNQKRWAFQDQSLACLDLAADLAAYIQKWKVDIANGPYIGSIIFQGKAKVSVKHGSFKEAKCCILRKPFQPKVLVPHSSCTILERFCQ